MAPTLPNEARAANLRNSEIRPRMAKVHSSSHRKTEITEYRAELGAAIERARCLSGLTLDQFAGEIKRDASQVGKWIRNIEPPQVDPIFMSPMRRFLLLALAEQTPGCEVESVIRLRRSACSA